MFKCELLSPAGNMEMLKYAVENGADAVYLAGVKFGARKFAANFDEEQMREAIEYAHLYGVKVYVTINTLVFEDEVEEFVKYVEFIYKIGVDAVLVQDFGMLNRLHRTMPNLELHASTQMHNNGNNMLELLKSCGVKRAVLDREMSLDDIENLKDKEIEKEVFVHGALCASYSGQCLFSSRVLNRSGNRGECAGMCRLPYRTKEDKQPRYYLSLKDLCSLEYLDKILEAGVDSLKIEGRMKSPEYVGYITRVYRRAIDSFCDGKFEGPSREEMRNIKILFNRGLTRGYLNGAQNGEMANLESPNHIGIHLGRYSVDGNKVKLMLNEDLFQGDTIRFKDDAKGMNVNFLYNKNGKLISKVRKGESAWVDNFLELEKSGELRLVGSATLNKSLESCGNRKVKLAGKVDIRCGEKARLEVSDGVNVVCKEGVIVVRAERAPLRKEDVIRQINKVGATVYEFESLDVSLDEDVFVNIKDLNSIRRDVLEELDFVRRTAKKETIFLDCSMAPITKIELKRNRIKVVVETKEQYEIARRFTEEVYTSNRELFEMSNDVKPKYEDNPSLIDEADYMISDYGSLLNVSQSHFVSTDYMMNVTNSNTANELLLRGVSLVGLSLELDDDRIGRLCKNTVAERLEQFIYGRVELMKMKYDPLTGENEELIDRNGKKYPIKRTKKFNYLLSSEALDRRGNLEKYMNMGISHFRVDFYDETKEECEKVLVSIINNLRKE